MSKIACIFPGQGSQSVGMGLDFFNHSSAARKIFELADGCCRTSLSKITFEGPESELKRTLYTQPAILAVSLSAWHAYFEAGGPEPEFVAGHSLGEYTALVSAGVIAPEDAIKLVVQRARLMESCPPGAMSAVIGSTQQVVEECCQKVSAELGGADNGNEVVVIANYNTAEQLVISGSPGAVQKASQLLKESGGKVIPLVVGGAFHSPLMKLAADEFVHHIESARFSNAAYPVVQNVDAQPSQDANVIKEKLSKQIASSVRWSQTIQYMLIQGVDTFVEIGPGKALSGMVKKLSKDAGVFSVSDMETLKAVISQLSE
jgi:[acyl-carrier-protein] S-malonyltransferase